MLLTMTRHNGAYRIPLGRPAPNAVAADRAARLDSRHGHLEGQELIRAVLRDPDAGRIALVSSFGTESAVLLHMIANIDPGTPILFIDSRKMFRETLDYVDELTGALGLRDVRRIQPGAHAIRRDDPRGDLWSRDSRKCCQLRKVAPLQRALAEFDLWITGRKRYQGDARAAMPLIETDGAWVKLNPLARWREDDIALYRRINELPDHPMMRLGYASVGCRPCTSPVAPGEHARAGRWRGQGRTECGIHTSQTSG